MTATVEETDYKDTLNLPVTDFAMKANLPQREPDILARWQEIDVYKKMLQRRDPAHSFILNDGPPYANGDIHIGHALNKILKDIIVKSKAIGGYYSPFIPGWDCHGLPIELQVEKKFGKAGVKIDQAEFRKKCREYANTQIDVQRKSFKRLGIFGDWENPYTTMDFKFEADTMRILGQIIKNGHLVRGDRPVHWCVDCGSSLAEAEVEYMEKTSDAIDVAFEIVDQNKVAEIFNTQPNQDKIAVVIWTTTPWTLPANQAVAINANLEYALVQYNQRRIIVAKDLVAAVMLRYGVENYTILGTCLGKDLELLLAQHPFYARQVPIILGDHVDIETGTGCVHTAPAHGNDDYVVGLKYKLPMDNPVDAGGCFVANEPLVGGQHVSKANPIIIQTLRDNGNLLADKQLTHSYPHCWRHKTPLIFRATPQWFISMDQNGLRSTALAEIKQVKWIPESGENRIAAMVAGRPDWCISRQRTWGTPLPVFIHKQTGELHPRTLEIIAQAADIVEKNGSEAWFDLAATDFLSAAEADAYLKSSDTLDVWFESGTVYSCVGDSREGMRSPADIYVEGSDQHRGWFQSSLLSSAAAKNEAPYKEVLTHGFTVDAQGRKMSKSMGNVIAPEKVIQSLGADVLRMWVAATDYTTELNISDEILKRISDSYRRIRNTARFLLSNLHGFDPEQDLVPDSLMLPLDAWIVDQTKALQEIVLQAYNEYDFLTIYQQVHNFCSLELGSFYLDIIKDRQYTCKTDGVPRRSAQTALYYILEAMTRWIAPILSFTAEEIWQHIPGKRAESVFLSDWYDKMPSGSKQDLNNDFWQQILLVRDEVNKVLEAARQKSEIGSGLEAEVTLYCAPELLQQLAKLKNELRFVLITSKANLLPFDQATKDAIATTLPTLQVLVKRSSDEKCERCWHRTEDVNKNPQYPNICGRCIENLTVGEKRIYA